MAKSNISDQRVNVISEKVVEAAKNVLGDNLSGIYLFGSYARGDFDAESDVDFLVVADVPQERAGEERRNIREKLPLIDLEYDLPVSLHVTGREIFEQYSNTLPFYMNVLNEGVELYV